ncbi:DUF1656 domain-containing protein [Methylobacterium nonmethylotrophicum]|uniref:DUF1656 domain-containing protein n=1 Tax=Methylobacterium nonmethylotrophicum TaxID=1141884 RepID=A0A4Z0NQN3_9HYPH|nr:DUF1656 domain-containing protein [Methylobacterium nonmethylotrophicum]TGD99353.1 DUF1656 domain-containing protein [Methylobacterium nonmethylotrophicum]
MADIDLYGVFVPALLVWAILAFLLNLVLRRLIGALGLYRLVWHRALFDLCLYLVCLGGVVTFAARLT